MSLVSVSRPVLITKGIDPAKADEVTAHIKDYSGAKYQLGIAARKQQAIADPANYIKDKGILWNAIINGDDGTATALDLALPGGSGTNPKLIPKMTALSEIWQTTYLSLTAYGVDNQTAAEEADQHTLREYNTRVEYISNAFPGFVDQAYNTGLDIKANANLAKAQSVLMPSALPSSTQPMSNEELMLKLAKFEKYKKGYKKHKATKKK